MIVDYNKAVFTAKPPFLYFRRFQQPNTLLLYFVTLSSIFASNVVFSQTNKSDIDDEIIVTATRTEKLVSEVAGTVSVITDEQIQYEIANDIADLVRFEPGVSVSGSGRFGLDGFTIRGIGGDRVLTLVDSTPTADEFSFGPFLSSSRNFVDLEGLKSVEIVRGPGSSIYGSNAIGGVVNFITKDPVDYLVDGLFAGSVKTGYSSIDNSMNTTVLGAFGNQVWSGLLVGTLREGSETETFFSDNLTGVQRNAQNPQDFENQNIYAKLVYSPNETHNFELVAEQFDGEVDTNVLTSVGVPVRGVGVNSEIGRDERRRERISLDYRLTIPTLAFDSLSLLGYLQNSDAEQNTISERVSAGVVQERVRDSFYEQENTGFRVQFNKGFEVANTSHQLTYGFDYDESNVETLRTGGTIVQATGAPVFEFLPFPTRDFPNSEYTSLGAFVQNDISFLDGRLHIIPALRYDDFELSPSADDIFFSGNPGQPEPEGYDESQLSAKIGLTFDLSEKWTLFAQFAEGFRAPPINAVNVGFTNLAGGYTTLSNSSLNPESAESMELGLRYVDQAASFEISAYKNEYKDFIEELSLLGFNPVTGLLEFQAINLDEAEINGFEAKASFSLGQISKRLDGFNIRAAYAYSEGDNQEDDQPLNSIDPEQLVLGLGYESSNDRWSVEALITATERKRASDIDSSSVNEIDVFETPGFAIVDLIGHFNASDNLDINWGIYNVTDKEYFMWSEEFVQSVSTTNFDRLTQAGRNYSVTVKYNF